MGSVVAWRGGVSEAVHLYAWVLVDAAGAVVGGDGDAAQRVTFRSAAKPFQLEVSCEALQPALTAGLTGADLALGASSHGARPRHTARAASLLGRFGCGVGQLYCGAHWPSARSAAQTLARRGLEPCALHNNCSGKHAFMAGACVAQGWEADYRPLGHPLQQRIAARVAERAGVASVRAVTDGCGVPCWVLPLSGMARAWAGLAVAVREREGWLGRIGAAMAANPLDAGDADQLDSRVMLASGGQLVAKIGAEGLVCVAFPERGLGLALKVASGNGEARAVALAQVLQGIAPDLLAFDAASRERPIYNVVGELVGERSDV